MQTYSVQSVKNRFENVQVPFAGFAGGREGSVRAPHYLTPLTLAGQRPTFCPDVQKLTQSIKHEISVQYLRQSLASSMTMITALEAAGLIHTPDLNKLHRAAVSANLTSYSKALTALLNTALSNLKHDIVDHVRAVFSGIDGVEPYLDKVFSSDDIYGLRFETSTRHSTGVPDALELKIYAKPFMELVYLDLPLEGESKDITPYLWNTVAALVQRGGGVVCENVYNCASLGYMSDYASDEVMAWLTNAVNDIESLPYDEPVSYLFNVECPKVKSFLEELQCSHWVFEDADGIDDIERDSLLEALNGAKQEIEAVLAHVPFTKGAPTDKLELLQAQWPEHPLTNPIRSLLQRHCDEPDFALDSFVAPDDMYYPFPFILHPSAEAFSDCQSELLNSIYEESMNVGEGFEWYKLDVTNGQWLAQLKGFVTCTCATVLAYTIIQEQFKVQE